MCTNNGAIPIAPNVKVGSINGTSETPNEVSNTFLVWSHDCELQEAPSHPVSLLLHQDWRVRPASLPISPAPQILIVGPPLGHWWWQPNITIACLTCCTKPGVVRTVEERNRLLEELSGAETKSHMLKRLRNLWLVFKVPKESFESICCAKVSLGPASRFRLTDSVKKGTCLNERMVKLWKGDLYLLEYYNSWNRIRS